MSRASRTIRHLTSAKYEDGVAAIPKSYAVHPTWVPRLTWKPREQVPFRPGDLARGIAGAGSGGPIFFCDNSFFDDRLDARVLKALLSGRERIALTAEVRRELEPWLTARPSHPLGRALRQGSRAIRPVSSPGLAGQGAFEYYVSLLLLRRAALRVARERFTEQFGRQPTEGDTAWLHGDLQRHLGERGMLLALKPASPIRTDEILVYLAVEFALSRGRPTVLLTKDADVEDQFYKLLWLIDTHYRGMLLAAAYANDPDAFPARPFPDDARGLRNFPFHEDAQLIERGGSSDLNHLLTNENYSFVAVECWRFFDSSYNKVVFGAEKRMREVLEIKSRTGGLSTDLLSGRNVHPWLMPLDLLENDRGSAGLVRDQRIPINGTEVQIPALDMMQALLNEERHQTVVSH